jgi:hypothetical protein
MTKIKVTNENQSYKSHKRSCCGGGHAKDQRATPDRDEQVHDDKHEHAHHSDGGFGRCGGGNMSK